VYIQLDKVFAKLLLCGGPGRAVRKKIIISGRKIARRKVEPDDVR
jgi:hypothetical protein